MVSLFISDCTQHLLIEMRRAAVELNWKQQSAGKAVMIMLFLRRHRSLMSVIFSVVSFSHHKESGATTRKQQNMCVCAAMKLMRIKINKQSANYFSNSVLITQKMPGFEGLGYHLSRLWTIRKCNSWRVNLCHVWRRQSYIISRKLSWGSVEFGGSRGLSVNRFHFKALGVQKFSSFTNTESGSTRLL